ncbi:MAG TPA: tetratricopeptide repeat protein [Methylocella sp.]|nr:tetratricopeptide repeat protein [Methylocella sp.]
MLISGLIVNRIIALAFGLFLALPAVQNADAANRNRHRDAGAPQEDSASVDRDHQLCDHSLANPAAGIPACTRLIDREGDGENTAGYYNNRGVAEIGTGDLNSAIDDFASALSRKPDFFDALKNRGIAYHMLGRYDDAIRDFNRAIELDSKQAAIYNARGTSLFRKDEFDQAIADYDKAIELDGTYAKAYVNRGQAFAAKRQFDRAIADFDAFIKLAPKNPLGLIQRGDARKEKGDFSGAITDYNLAIGLDPKSWEAYTHEGEAKRLNGDLAGSLADHDKAIELNTNPKEAYVNRALTLKDQGKYDQAAASCDKAILIDPNYSPAFLNRGLIRRLSGDLKGSANDLDRAVALDPRFHLALSFRGDTRRDLGDSAGALSDYSQAIALWPDFIPAYVGRGLTYEKVGDPEKAKADFDKAMKLPPSPDGLANPAQQVARTHLAELATKLVPHPDELAALSAKAEREAAEKAKQELQRAKEEADRRVREATEESKKVREELERLRTEAERRAKETPDVIPDPGTRVALVIGNSRYQNVEFLPNPQRDAEAVADALKQLGFRTTLLKDITLKELLSALESFGELIKQGADWSVIYFAGHGIEIGGINYIIPVDASLMSDSAVKYEAVPLDDLLSVEEKARKLRIVILDACRNNPFVPKMKFSVASRSVGRGFARVEPQASTLIAFSAGDGQTANDGESEHSPFTQAFLKNVNQPRMEVGMLFRRVYDQVRIATNGQQLPATHYSLPGELFYFATK